jgi:hypothetical protein
MNAVTRLFQRDQTPVLRGSERIREELNALPHPSRYSDMLVEIGRRREQIKALSGEEFKDAQHEVDSLITEAAAYRSHHAKVFDQAEALGDELVQVQHRERQVMIADRLKFHLTVERAETVRLIAAGEAAKVEGMAQEIATHLLAKAWEFESAAPWIFGYPSDAITNRAREIVAELQGA